MEFGAAPIARNPTEPELLQKLIGMRSQMLDAQPWIREVERFVQTALIGRQARNARMSSDYAGSDRNSDYLTFSYLIADKGVEAWDDARNDERIRSQTLDRRLSYKRFRPRARGPELDWWLEATKHLSGELFVFAFSKEVLRDMRPIRPPQSYPLVAKWKPQVLEDAVRKALLGGVLTANKLLDGGYLNWITDQDQAVANAAAKADFMHLASILADMFSPLKRRFVTFGTTEADCIHRFREDMNSVADLCAGMAAELLTAVRRKSDGTVLDLDAVTSRCETVATWFWRAPHGPRRLCIVIDRDPKVSVFEM